MKYIPKTQAEINNLKVKIEKQSADIDYIAMMSDIELEEDNESEISEG